MIKKFKNTVQKVKNNVISDLNDQENVKWKGYDNSFNS